MSAVLLAWGLAFSLVGTCPCAVEAPDTCGGRVDHSTASPCCEKTSSRPELRAVPCCDSGEGNGVGIMTASIAAPGPASSFGLAAGPDAALPLAAGAPSTSHGPLPPRVHASPVLRI